MALYLPNAAILYNSSSCCGNPQLYKYFIETCFWPPAPCFPEHSGLALGPDRAEQVCSELRRHILQWELRGLCGKAEIQKNEEMEQPLQNWQEDYPSRRGYGLQPIINTQNQRGQAGRPAPNFWWVIPNRQINYVLGREGDHIKMFMEEMREIRRKLRELQLIPIHLWGPL